MNQPGPLEFNKQANTLRDERGFVADCNGMPPHYRSLFLAAPHYHVAVNALLTKLDSLSKNPAEAWPLLTGKEIREIVEALRDARTTAETP